jgi:hypothetical protein
MLERMGVEDAQSFSAGDMVELANLIDDAAPEPKTDIFLMAMIDRECGPVPRIRDMLWAVEVARATERAHGIFCDEPAGAHWSAK